jgi:hypothetical protein
VLENQFSLLNSLWFTIGSLMQQGSDIAPKWAEVTKSLWWNSACLSRYTVCEHKRPKQVFTCSVVFSLKCIWASYEVCTFSQCCNTVSLGEESLTVWGIAVPSKCIELLARGHSTVFLKNCVITSMFPREQLSEVEIKIEVSVKVYCSELEPKLGPFFRLCEFHVLFCLYF